MGASQTERCTRITWRACYNTDDWAIIPSDATADGPWTTDLNDSNYSLNKAFLVRIYLIKHSKQNSKEHITCDIKNVYNF